MKKKTFAELLGWYGTFAIIFAYFLVSFGVVEAKSVIFQILNFSGAIGLMVISVYRKVTQSIMLNLFWALIALIAIARLILV